VRVCSEQLERQLKEPRPRPRPRAALIALTFLLDKAFGSRYHLPAIVLSDFRNLGIGRAGPPLSPKEAIGRGSLKERDISYLNLFTYILYSVEPS